MFLQVEVKPSEIVNSFASSSVGKEDLIKLIADIDLDVAEVDFTLDLIKVLVKSLKSDLSNLELRIEIANILDDILED